MWITIFSRCDQIFNQQHDPVIHGVDIHEKNYNATNQVKVIYNCSIQYNFFSNITFNLTQLGLFSQKAIQLTS